MIATRRRALMQILSGKLPCASRAHVVWRAPLSLARPLKTSVILKRRLSLKAQPLSRDPSEKLDAGTSCSARTVQPCSLLLRDFGRAGTRRLSAELTNGCKVFRFEHPHLNCSDTVQVVDSGLVLGAVRETPAPPKLGCFQCLRLQEIAAQNPRRLGSPAAAGAG